MVPNGAGIGIAKAGKTVDGDAALMIVYELAIAVFSHAHVM